MERVPVNSALRIQVASRQGFHCAHCDVLFTESWSIDHILPLKDGGSDSPANMQALCKECHAEKTSDEAALRSKRCFKTARRQIYSWDIFQRIFDAPLSADAYIPAGVALDALADFKRTLTPARLAEFLSLYDVTVEHPPLKVLKNVFSVSFGVFVRRLSSKVTDDCYNTLLFSLRCFREALAEGSRGVHQTVEDTVDMTMTPSSGSTHLRGDGHPLSTEEYKREMESVIEASGFKRDRVSAAVLLDIMKGRVGVATAQRNRAAVVSIGGTFSENTVVNGTRARAFMRVRFTSEVLEQLSRDSKFLVGENGHVSLSAEEG